MNENKITFLVVLLVLLAVYQVRQWLAGDSLVDCPEELQNNVCMSRVLGSAGAIPIRPTKITIPMDVCTVLDVLTLRASPPPRRCRLTELRARRASEQQKDENPTATTVTIVMLLLLSTFKNVHDVMRSRREAALRQEREPEEARRRSLAEFAERAERKARRFFPDKPTLLQLTEPFLASRRLHQFTRADSSNSYLSEHPPAQESLPARNSAADCSTPVGAGAHDDRFMKAPVVKLFGGRPAPLLTRRSSVPVMQQPPHSSHPAHPAIDQLRQEPRRLSICDSEDESSSTTDPRAARRVRLIRRH